MRIDSSTVGMESARTYRSTSTRKLSASFGISQFNTADALNNQNLLGGSLGNLDTENSDVKEDANTSDSTDNAFDFLSSSALSSRNRIQQIQNNTEASSIERIRERCILHLWELFFGKERAEELAKDYNFSTESTSLTNIQTSNMQVMNVSITEEYSFEETENVDFSTTGKVITSDGREINFNLNVNMSRSFSEYYTEHRSGTLTMCDPLVINLDNSIAGLSDQKFFFDLDCDGEKEEISTLESGNAFLSLDKNNDGTINDGSELFGTKSGDGFSDLAKYDEDGNGWIDENDAVYDMLKIWVKDESGEDKLYTLKEKNVGAIYLGHTQTDFTLRSGNSGKINGAIRKTGIFLYENGVAGTVSHLDMAN